MDNSQKKFSKMQENTHIPLLGRYLMIFEDVKEIGLEKNINKIKKFNCTKINSIPNFSKKGIDCSVEH